MELRDVAGEPLSTIIKQSATAMDAITMMMDKQVHSVLVDREDNEDAYGILTVTDIINKVVATGLNPTEVEVTEICSKPLVIVNNPDLDIRWVAKKMADEGISRVAMFDGEVLGSLVTDVDILKAMAKELREKKQRKKVKDKEGVEK